MPRQVSGPGAIVDLTARVGDVSSPRHSGPWAYERVGQAPKWWMSEHECARLRASLGMRDPLIASVASTGAGNANAPPVERGASSPVAPAPQ